MFMFLKMNYKCHFDKQFLHESGTNVYLELPMTNEEIIAPMNFVKEINEILECIPKRGLIKENNKTLVSFIKFV